MVCACNQNGMGYLGAAEPTMTAAEFVRALGTLPAGKQKQVLRLLTPEQAIVVHDTIVEMMEQEQLQGMGELGSWLSSLLGKAKDVIGDVAKGAGKLIGNIAPIAAPLASLIPIVGPAVGGLISAVGGASGSSGTPGINASAIPPGYTLVAPGSVPGTVKTQPAFKIDQRTLLVVAVLGTVLLMSRRR